MWLQMQVVSGLNDIFLFNLQQMQHNIFLF